MPHCYRAGGGLPLYGNWPAANKSTFGMFESGDMLIHRSMKLIIRPLVLAIAGASFCWASQARAQDAAAIEQQGKASYYSDRLQGKKTASGALMDQGALTAASRRLPLGAKAKVTDLETGKTANVKITDRGPVPKGRVIDVSKQAANQLGIKKEEGVAPVKVETKATDQPTPELKYKVEQAAKH
jgi:rare lipoprotein A